MVGHIKEESQKKRLINSLTTDWKTQTIVCSQSQLHYYRGKELLEILEKENKAEKKVQGFYS